MDRKESKKESDRKYREKNREKLKECSKKYREKNKEYFKEYHKEYRENNKEQIKEYYQNNKEQIKEYQKEQQKEYIKTPQGKKTKRISSWKRQGIIFFDYNELYEIYINTEYCNLCNVKLTTGKTTSTHRCLDHDHSITDCDNVRNILCHSCNIKRG